MAMTCILVDIKEQTQPHAPVYYSYLIKIHSFFLHIFPFLLP